MQGGGKLKTSLVLNLYSYRSDTPLDRNRPDLDEAWGGFALEIGDATEFKDFDAFQQHMAAIEVETLWDTAEKTVHAKLVSATDTLEVGFKPGYTGNWDRSTPTDQCFPYRRVNGAWPYLPKDVERDTTLSQISRSGRVEKGGAVLTVEPGRIACVEFEPVSGTFVGCTPLPDATAWKFELPDGIAIEADGKVGMLRATVNPGAGRLAIEHALRPGDSTVGMAETLRVNGLEDFVVEMNGRPVTLSADRRVRLSPQDSVPLSGSAPLASSAYAALDALFDGAPDAKSGPGCHRPATVSVVGSAGMPRSLRRSWPSSICAAAAPTAGKSWQTPGTGKREEFAARWMKRGFGALAGAACSSQANTSSVSTSTASGLTA